MTDILEQPVARVGRDGDGTPQPVVPAEATMSARTPLWDGLPSRAGFRFQLLREPTQTTPWYVYGERADAAVTPEMMSAGVRAPEGAGGPPIDAPVAPVGLTLTPPQETAAPPAPAPQVIEVGPAEQPPQPGAAPQSDPPEGVVLDTSADQRVQIAAPAAPAPQASPPEPGAGGRRLGSADLRAMRPGAALSPDGNVSQAAVGALGSLAAGAVRAGAGGARDAVQSTLELVFDLYSANRELTLRNEYIQTAMRQGIPYQQAWEMAQAVERPRSTPPQLPELGAEDAGAAETIARKFAEYAALLMSNPARGVGRVAMDAAATGAARVAGSRAGVVAGRMADWGGRGAFADLTQDPTQGGAVRFLRNVGVLGETMAALDATADETASALQRLTSRAGLALEGAAVGALLDGVVELQRAMRGNPRLDAAVRRVLAGGTAAAVMAPEEAEASRLLSELMRRILAAQAEGGTAVQQASRIGRVMRDDLPEGAELAAPRVPAALTPANLARTYAQLDQAAASVRDPLGRGQWQQLQPYLRDAPRAVDGVAPPVSALREPTWLRQMAGNTRELQAWFNSMTPDQVAAARAGIQTTRDIGALYRSGQARQEDTAALLLWGILSRQLSARPHEAAFIELFELARRHAAAAMERGQWTVAPELRGAAPQGGLQFVPGRSDADDFIIEANRLLQGTPASQGTNNAWDWARILMPSLIRQARGAPEGVTRLEAWHRALEQPDVSGRELRRYWYELTEGESVGIGNKVLSFHIATTGRHDVIVLDRVQINQWWTGQQEVNAYPALYNQMEGGGGLAVYEAIERSLQRRVGALYAGAGRAQEASVFGFHWDSWVLASGQVVEHPTLDLIRRRIGGQQIGTPGVREGRYYERTAGAEYRRTADGWEVVFDLPDGRRAVLQPSAVDQALDWEQLERLGITPRDFPGVNAFKGFLEVPGRGRTSIPWHEWPGIDRDALARRVENYAERIETAAERGPGGAAEGAAGDGLPRGDRPTGRPAADERADRQRRAVGVFNGPEIPVRERDRAGDPRGADAVSARRFAGGSAGRHQTDRAGVDALIADLAPGLAPVDEAAVVVTTTNARGQPLPANRLERARTRALEAAQAERRGQAVLARFEMTPEGRGELRTADTVTPILDDAGQPTDRVRRQQTVATPSFYELNTQGAGVEMFRTALQRAREAAGPNGQAVHVYEPGEYAGMRLFLGEDGRSGFALKGDDIVSVFSQRDRGAPGLVATSLLRLAVEQGGRRLDAYETELGSIYSRNGFRVVSRIPFSDAAASPDWPREAMVQFNGGRPDVIFMVYDPAGARAQPYRPGESGQRFGADQYDEAAALQQAEVRRLWGAEGGQQ